MQFRPVLIVAITTGLLSVLGCGSNNGKIDKPVNLEKSVSFRKVIM